MKQIKVSIVTYNSENVFKCLDFLLETVNLNEVNICIHDNNSTQEYKNKLLKYQDEIELTFGEKNLGFGGGHNANLLNSNEKYFIIYNPDILATQEDIVSLLATCEEDKSIVLISPRVVYENGRDQYLVRNDINVFDFFLRRQPFGFLRNLFKERLRKFENQYLPLDKLSEIQLASGCFIFVRGDAFKKINGFDDKFFMYFEDYDLSKRIKTHGRVVYNPFVSIVHFWERGAHKNRKLLYIFIRSMMTYFNKWGWKLF